MATNNFTPFAPAFPSDAPKGLTILAYLAAQAMQGILAATKPSEVNPEEIAEQAIQCAGALFSQLSDRHGNVTARARPLARGEDVADLVGAGWSSY